MTFLKILEPAFCINRAESRVGIEPFDCVEVGAVSLYEISDMNETTLVALVASNKAG